MNHLTKKSARTLSLGVKTPMFGVILRWILVLLTVVGTVGVCEVWGETRKKEVQGITVPKNSEKYEIKNPIQVYVITDENEWDEVVKEFYPEKTGRDMCGLLVHYVEKDNPKKITYVMYLPKRKSKIPSETTGHEFLHILDYENPDFSKKYNVDEYKGISTRECAYPLEDWK